MVLTTDELIASLQNEVRILLHLAGKLQPEMLDYRPTARQRSSIELLRYLVVMGPQMIASIRTGTFDRESWQKASSVANAADFTGVLALIAGLHDQFPALLAAYSDDDLRGKVEMFGRSESRGSILVNLVLAAYAAYRTQLFLYLKSCGREELSTMNLWGGVDAPMG